MKTFLDVETGEIFTLEGDRRVHWLFEDFYTRRACELVVAPFGGLDSQMHTSTTLDFLGVTRKSDLAILIEPVELVRLGAEILDHVPQSSRGHGPPIGGTAVVEGGV